MSTFDNYTIFGMHSNAERYSWAAYHLFVALSSLIGDTLILYASFQKDAFRLNKFIVTVIRCIAVSDLAYTIVRVLPGTISLIAGKWVLGNGICIASVYLYNFIYLAGMFFITVLTTSKLLLLKYPIRCAILTSNTALQICSLALIPPLTIPMIMLIVDNEDVTFDYRLYVCSYGFKAEPWKKILPPLSVFILFLPNFVLIATTIPTLRYLAVARKSARRVRGSVPWQGALTVVLTATTYCVSTLPLCIQFIGKMFFTDPRGMFHFQFYRLAMFTAMINIMSNFYIYALTVKSFQRFLSSKVLSILSNFSPATEVVPSIGKYILHFKLRLVFVDSQRPD